ncbi:MAG: response regulator transcription factor [Candidatus Sulfotelmatobacter sp.]
MKRKAGIRVAVIESDPLRLAGFRALLECQERLELESLQMPELGTLSGIDVLILGKRQGENLSALMGHLKAIRPDVRVILTARSSDDESILNALANGVKGYVNEAATASEFVSAIHVVHDGLIWSSRRLLGIFIERSNNSSRRAMGNTELTAREREVLEMLVDGRSNKEIAVPLGIEERTVKAHVAKMMRKIGVQNRIMLSVHAVNRALVVAR